MMPLEPLSPHWSDLFAALADGTISDADFAELEQLLANDSDALLAYVRYVDLHVCLPRHLAAEEAVAGGQLQVVNAELVARDKQETVSNQESESPVLGFLGRGIAVLSQPVLWSILCVGIAFFGYVAVISWGIRDRAPHDNHLTAARGTRMTGRHGMTESIATITYADDESHIAARSAHVVQPGESLKIGSGLVELKLTRGTTVLVEGPAQWSIDGDNHATLYAGKLVAKVPSRAIGFTLETPTVQIVDLGTEFGVEVHQDGSATVEVFRGVVESRSTRGVNRPVQRLVTGEAARFDRSGSSSVAANATRFSRVAKPTDSSVRLAAIFVKPSRGEQGAFPAANDDLINAGQPTLSNVRHEGYTPFSIAASNSTAGALHDGHTLLLPPRDPKVLADGAFDEDGTWKSQFDLNVELHPDGYTIDEIRSISEWIPNRCNQHYVVKYATVDADDFVELVRASYDGTGVNGAGMVTIRRPHGPLAMRVRSLRFEFEPVANAASNEPGVYSEIDVLGSPTSRSDSTRSQPPP